MATRCGGSDLDGEQTCGPEHNEMTAAPKLTDRPRSRWPVNERRRPGLKAGKAEALGEETGMCTPGAAGVGVQARREGLSELTLGTTISQRGLTATREDPSTEGEPEGDGRDLVGRMSPQERRRGGNAPRGGGCDATPEPVTPGLGKGTLATWPLFVERRLPDTEPGLFRPSRRASLCANRGG